MRYILGVLGAILLLILVFVMIFRGGGSDTQTVVPAQIHLADYASKNSTVVYTTVGSVVGQESQRTIRIVVTPSERRLEVLSDYQQTVLSSQAFSNSTAAYEAFLSALDGQGFTASKKSSVDDPQTICPTGQRYVYDLTEDGQEVSSLWSVTCDRSGTFKGVPAVVQQLFQDQIPNYDDLVRNVDL